MFESGGPASNGALFPSDDGMAKLADLFVSTAGRELSSEALQVLLFLEENGSRGLAREIMAKKQFMTSSSDLASFIEKYSPASHAKDMMEAQTKARADSMAGR